MLWSQVSTRNTAIWRGEPWEKQRMAWIWKGLLEEWWGDPGVCSLIPTHVGWETALSWGRGFSGDVWGILTEVWAFSCKNIFTVLRAVDQLWHTKKKPTVILDVSWPNFVDPTCAYWVICWDGDGWILCVTKCLHLAWANPEFIKSGNLALWLGSCLFWLIVQLWWLASQKFGPWLGLIRRRRCRAFISGA